MTTDSDLDLLLIRPDDAPDEVWAAQVDEPGRCGDPLDRQRRPPLQFTEAEVVAIGRQEPSCGMY